VCDVSKSIGIVRLTRSLQKNTARRPDTRKGHRSWRPGMSDRQRLAAASAGRLQPVAGPLWLAGHGRGWLQMARVGCGWSGRSSGWPEGRRSRRRVHQGLLLPCEVKERGTKASLRYKLHHGARKGENLALGDSPSSEDGVRPTGAGRVRCGRSLQGSGAGGSWLRFRATPLWSGCRARSRGAADGVVAARRGGSERRDGDDGASERRGLATRPPWQRTLTASGGEVVAVARSAW